MRIAAGFCLRELLGEYIAVPTGAAAAGLSGLVSLNESGAFLFRLLEQEQTEDTLTQALLREYETDEHTARQDVCAFLGIMRDNGLLIEEASPKRREGCG